MFHKVWSTFIFHHSPTLKNHSGSAGAMEVNGAGRIFKRSIEKMGYVTQSIMVMLIVTVL